MSTGEQALWSAILEHLEITEKLLEQMKNDPRFRELYEQAATLRERIEAIRSER